MAGGFSPERMTMVSQGYSTSPQIACSSNIVHMPIASASHTSSTSVVSRDCNGTPSSGSSGDDGSFADVPNPSQASNCFYAHYQDQHYDVAVKDSSTDTDFAISQAAVSDVMKGVIYSGGLSTVVKKHLCLMRLSTCDIIFLPISFAFIGSI